MPRLLAASAVAALLLAGLQPAQAEPRTSGARDAAVAEFSSSHKNRHYRRMVWASDPAKHYWRQYRPPVPCSVQPTYPCDPEAYFGLYTRPYKYAPSHYASFRYYGPVKPYYPGASWW